MALRRHVIAWQMGLDAHGIRPGHCRYAAFCSSANEVPGLLLAARGWFANIVQRKANNARPQYRTSPDKSLLRHKSDSWNYRGCVSAWEPVSGLVKFPDVRSIRGMGVRRPRGDVPVPDSLSTCSAETPRHRWMAVQVA